MTQQEISRLVDELLISARENIFHIHLAFSKAPLLLNAFEGFENVSDEIKFLII